MKIPKKLLNTKQRKQMWKDGSRIVKRLDKILNFSEIYAIGSFFSHKKNPYDIDFTLVAKIKKDNNAWPIDLVIVPEGEKTKKHIKFCEDWMNKKYGKNAKVIKLK